MVAWLDEKKKKRIFLFIPMEFRRYSKGDLGKLKGNSKRYLR